MAGMYATDLPPRPRSRMPYVAFTEAHQAHARSLAEIWRGRYATGQAKRYYVDDGDDDGFIAWYVGALGEVACCLLTSRPLILPTVAAETWRGPDVAGYSVRTTGTKPNKPLFMNLLLRPGDDDPESTHHSYAVIVLPPPYREAWLAGVITRERAKQLRRWETRLRKPGWVVENPHLVDYVGPPPPLPPKGWRPPTVDEIFKSGRSHGQ